MGHHPEGRERDERIAAADLPAGDLSAEKMPGHWLLARLGKRVLRPGGRELTERMLDALAIGPDDDVVELAPGLGVTARLTLARDPASYTAVERDESAARIVERYLDGPHRRCRIGSADATGLDDASASVVYGEAMLSMQTEAGKTAIAREAFRILRPGGRYALHELCLGPGDVGEEVREHIGEELSHSIHVGVRPLTEAEWRALLEREGFEVESVTAAPMHLLEPGRIVRDEGLGGALRLLWNLARDPVARKRVLEMRRGFRRHRENLSAVAVVARKPGESGAA